MLRNRRALLNAAAILAATLSGLRAWRQLSCASGAIEVSLTLVSGVVLSAVFVWLASRERGSSR